MAKSVRGSNDSSGSEGSKGAIVAAAVANLAIAVTKFVAAAFTGSSSMFAEGVHSVIDTANQGFLLIGLSNSKKPADEKHPFGYGAEVYFWSFLVAIFLFALGAGFSTYEGVMGIISGEAELTSPLIALGVLFLAFCFEGYSWSVAFREFQHRRRGNSLLRDFHDMKDPSIFVVLFEDTAACIGIVIAAGGIGLSWATGNHIFDAIGSILIGVLLGVTAILLAIEVKSLLIGERADPEIEALIREKLGARPEILAINELKTLHLGPQDVLLTMSIDFKDDVVSQRIEAVVSEIERRIRERFPIVRKVYVEVQSQSGHGDLARADAEAHPVA